MTTPVRRSLFLLTTLAIAVSTAHAQTIIPQNLGGGCGGTLGYPTLQRHGSLLLFRIQRRLCHPNGIAFPSVLMIGTQTINHPIPFAPGVVPGCVWSVLPEGTLPVPGPVGGEGVSIWLGDVAGVPSGTVVHMQALVTCSVHGSLETSATDGWTLSFR